jgi:hypothetical protein
MNPTHFKVLAVTEMPLLTLPHLQIHNDRIAAGKIN